MMSADRTVHLTPGAEAELALVEYGPAGRLVGGVTYRMSLSRLAASLDREETTACYPDFPRLRVTLPSSPGARTENAPAAIERLRGRELPLDEVMPL